MVGADAIGGELERGRELGRDPFAGRGELRLADDEVVGRGTVDGAADAPQGRVAAVADLGDDAADRFLEARRVVVEAGEDFALDPGERALVGPAAGQQRLARRFEAVPALDFRGHAPR